MSGDGSGLLVPWSSCLVSLSMVAPAWMVEDFLYVGMVGGIQHLQMSDMRSKELGLYKDFGTWPNVLEMQVQSVFNYRAEGQWAGERENSSKTTHQLFRLPEMPGE